MEPLQSTLLAHLSQVPDFRRARGQRFAWAYLLALVAAAVAAGQTSVLAMVTGPTRMPANCSARCNRPVHASPVPPPGAGC